MHTDQSVDEDESFSFHFYFFFSSLVFFIIDDNKSQSVKMAEVQM